MHVEAVRGLEIPLYPGHPDRWDGNDQVALVDRAHEVTHVGDARSTFYACAGNESCLRPIRPALGAIVPDGTATVEVLLSWDTPEPAELGLYFHGANDDEFVELDLVEAGASSRSASILVERGMQDGPYAQQSLWEFLPYIAGPARDAAFSGNYTLSVTAVRG